MAAIKRMPARAARSLRFAGVRVVTGPARARVRWSVLLVGLALLGLGSETSVESYSAARSGGADELLAGGRLVFQPAAGSPGLARLGAFGPSLTVTDRWSITTLSFAGFRLDSSSRVEMRLEAATPTLAGQLREGEGSAEAALAFFRQRLQQVRAEGGTQSLGMRAALPDTLRPDPAAGPMAVGRPRLVAAATGATAPLGPWRAVAVSCQFAGGLLMLVCALWGVARSWVKDYVKQSLARAARGICPACGYNVTTGGQTRCPECGVELAASVQEIKAIDLAAREK